MFSALNLKIGLHNGSLNMETAEFVVAQYKIIILCARTHGIKGVMLSTQYGPCARVQCDVGKSTCTRWYMDA